MYICNKRGDKILDELPRYKSGGFKGKINHKAMVEMSLNVEYAENVYSGVKILKHIKNGTNSKFEIEYNGNISVIQCSDFLCGKFGGVLNLTNRDYRHNVGKAFKNGFVILKQGYTTDKRGCKQRAYNIRCTKCGFNGGEHYKNGELIEEYWISEYKLEKGNGCPCCCHNPQIVVQEVNSMWKTDHWMVELGVDEEFAKTHTAQSNKKAPCKCPHCGEIKYKSVNKIYRDKSISCTCGDGFSYPEKFMYNILKQLNIEFETQYSPNYLKLNDSQKKSDFYILSLNLVIETDGELGHEYGRVYSKSTKTLDEHVEIDKWKDEQHLKYGVKTIRINCFESNMEYIRENILNSKLNELFDLSNIDWNKTNEFAWFSNLRKEVCDYWNTKEDWETTKDLAEKFDMGKHAVIRYLKTGTKVGWCKYDTKEEMHTNGSKNGKLKRKPVEIFKDGISLGMFESAKELEKQSEKLFEVKMLHGNISAVANGGRRQYKGFTFKY